MLFALILLDCVQDQLKGPIIYLLKTS